MGGRHVKEKEQKGESNGEAQVERTRQLYAEFKEVCWWLESRMETDAKTPRVTGTMSIFAQDGGVKVCVRDRAAGRVAFVWGKGAIEALLAAEEALTKGTLDWRVDRFAAE
jgi:hypothetical protein